MPVFQWRDDGELNQEFHTTPQSAPEMIYRMLTRLPHDWAPSGRLKLRMFSSLEGRWLDLFNWPVDRPAWPFINVYLIHRNLDELFREVRRHSQSQNPCGEIPLGEPEEDQLTKHYAEIRAKGDPIKTNGESSDAMSMMEIAARIGTHVVAGRTRNY